MPGDSEELKRHIAFREYLRSHPEAVREYSRIKEEGAALYPFDIEKYIEHKSPFVEKSTRNRDMTNSCLAEVVENEKSEFEAEVCIMNIDLVVYNLVIPFLDYIGVLFAIFKEKQQNLFRDLIHFLKKNRHCMIKLISRDIRNQCFMGYYNVGREHYYPAF